MKGLTKKNVIVSVVICVIIAGYFASKLEFEEDISKIIPATQELQQLNNIYNNSNFLERLVVKVSLKDTLADPDPEKLIEYTSALISRLKNDSLSRFINKIMYRVDDNTMGDVYSVFCKNMPLFLSKKDYETIDTLITKTSIKKIVQQDYKRLISPASVVFKKYILLDPLGFTPIILKKLQGQQLSDTYSLYDGYIFTKGKRNLLFFISSSNALSETSENSIL